MEKSPKKWSLGNILFRKSKKDIPQADFSSDDDDRKAGFGDFVVKKSPSKAKSNKHLVQNFDQQQYSVANPEFHYFKPAPPQINQPPPPQANQLYRQPQIYANQANLEFINNQINLDKSRSAQPQYIFRDNNTYHQCQGSSQDEKSSYNSLSSPINKNGSETGSRTSLNKRTRNARNERYYQRMMRDDGRPLTVYGSVNSIENQKYQPPLNGAQNRLSASINGSSLCSSDFMLPLSHQSQSLPIPRYRGAAEDDKDDYENIHEVDEAVPPPIPPRDPNRRFSINSSSVSQHPYYFDHALQKYVIFNTNGKCFSDDKLWKNDSESIRPQSVKADKLQPHDILRPRSRKPLNLNTNLDNECVFSSEDVVDNPRYSVAQSKRSKSAIDFEKLMNEPVRARFSARQRNLTSVEPIRYQPPVVQAHSQEFCNEELLALRKKYSSAEDVNRNKPSANMRVKLPSSNGNNNTPGSRKSFNALDLKVRSGNNVSSNLDEAINELELMYKSLVKDEGLMERAERRDLPTPTKFSMMMRKYEEYENEENKNDKEPDIVLDDVFSRNLKHANQMLKASEPLPFGIPNQKLCPIAPKPSQDYLSVEPIQTRKSLIVAQNNPDLIADDLAVRNLRKDNPNYGRRRNLIEIDNNHFMKRNHTLSSLSEHIYNGILKDSARPSGGRLEDYLQLEASKSSGDVKSTLYLVNNKQAEPKTDNRNDFEASLNALVVESKAISQKLEKDLSKLKRESVTPNPPKTLVNLLDFRRSVEKEKKSTSSSPVKMSAQPAVEEPSKLKPKVKMTSTACSPIKDFEVAAPAVVEDIVKSQAPKQQKTEKIGNLIKMFNTNLSPEPVKKATPAKIPIEKTSRKISDLSGMFNKAPEIESKPPPQPTHVPLRKSSSNEDKAAAPLRIISPKIVSPTVMHPRIVSPKVLMASSVAETKSQVDVESNINNIKELIQQIKQTEFDKNQKESKSDALKNDLPDYDNIKDDYEMTDEGRLERITKPEPLRVSIPKESVNADDNSPDVKSITTTSSSLRETSVESTSKEGTPKSEYADESAAIYKDAMEFLNETAETAATASEHKSPIKSIRHDKDAVLGYIEKINENLVVAKRGEEPKMNVKESITKLESKISLSRQNSETSEQSYSTPKQSSPPVNIRPVVLPKVGPSDTESLYNSSEELSMIFGMGEQQKVSSSVVQPGKIVEEDFEAEFEKIAHDDDIVDDELLDENFNVTLIDLNNNTDNLYVECLFDNELSGMSSATSATKADPSPENDANNNSLTATDLSKLSECQTNQLTNRKPKASTSNSSHGKSGSGAKSESSSSSTATPPSPLKAQCILLACVYCIMLYLQFIIFNFKSS